MQFQSVWGVAPTESGIQLLLFIFFFPVGSAFWCNDGETGRYKPFHLAGFMFCTLSFGFCSILDRYTYKAVYVFFDIFDAFGIGIPMACLLPPVQAPLKDGDTLLYTIEDESARTVLSGGKAYQLASAAFSNQLTGATRDQVTAVYTASLQRMWEIAVVFAGGSFLVALLEKEIPLHQNLDREFGMEIKRRSRGRK
ncbi:hypothetical protein F5B18DRAFT_607193 [Nemania serpens]|nr:hypothetical protein F5B18DRAFT_607193 [Nemania serpens]